MDAEPQIHAGITRLVRNVLDGETGPHPVWEESPTARRVAAVRDRDRPFIRRGGRFLAVAAVLATGALTAALVGGLVGGQPRFDGGLPPGILAVAHTDGLDFAEPDGADRMPVLTDGPTFNPRWSPDGTHLAVSQLGRTDANLLRILRRDGTTVGQAPGVFDFRWGPAGDRLAIHLGASNEIAIIDTTGRLVARPLLPEGALTIGSFDWSPDGRRIVLAACADCDLGDPDATAPYALWILDVSGGSPTDFLRSGGDRAPDPDRIGVFPAWSPDGSRIAYVVPGCADGSCTGFVRIVDASTGVRRAEAEEVIGGSDVSWSPDSRRLAFRADVDGQGEIFVATADMSTVARLTTSGDDDRMPVWRSDSDSLLFTRQVRDGGQLEVWATHADGTQQVRLVDDSYGAALQPTR